MGEIPGQLAASLGNGIIQLGRKVGELVDREVRVVDGDRVTGDAVIVATDGPASASLLGGQPPRARGVTGLFFAASDPPFVDPLLVLDGTSQGVINNLAVMSNVAPSYAPPGRALIAAQALDTSRGTESMAREEMKRWFGPAVDDWDLIATRRIDYAQPDQRPPYAGTRSTRVRPGVYVAGDHLTSASINGALRSGRRAAEAVIADLGAG